MHDLHILTSALFTPISPTLHEPGSYLDLMYVYTSKTASTALYETMVTRWMQWLHTLPFKSLGSENTFILQGAIQYIKKSIYVLTIDFYLIPMLFFWTFSWKKKKYQHFSTV